MKADPDATATAIDIAWRLVPHDQAPQLALGRPAPHQRLYQLDWTLRPTPLDEGLPPELTDALSQAFCAVAAVCFLSETAADGRPLPRLPAWRRGLRRIAGAASASAWTRHPDAWSRPIAGLNEPLLLCTRAPTLAQALFDIGAWHLSAAQVVFFCPPEATPPALPDALVREAAHGKDWSRLGPTLQALGLWGVATQGHDGEGLELLPLVPELAPRLAQALAQQAHARGWGWRD